MAKIGSVHKAKISYRDATGEVSPVEVYTGAITALSIAGFLADFGDFQAATDAITLGTRATQSWTGDYTTVSNAVPTDPSAQRECKLLVTYMDVTDESTHTLTVPTIDFSKLVFTPGAKDAVVFSGGSASNEIKAWVTAFETLAKSPTDDTHAVQVTKMRFVGVNS